MVKEAAPPRRLFLTEAFDQEAFFRLYRLADAQQGEERGLLELLALLGGSESLPLLREAGEELVRRKVDLPAPRTDARLQRALEHLFRAGLVQTDGFFAATAPAIRNHVFQQLMLGGRGAAYAEALAPRVSVARPSYTSALRELEAVFRRCRLLLAQGDGFTFMLELDNAIRRYPQEFAPRHAYDALLARPWNPAWFASLPAQLRGDLLFNAVHEALSGRLDWDAPLPGEAARVCREGPDSERRPLLGMVATAEILRGNWSGADAMLAEAGDETSTATLCRGWLALYRDQPEAARLAFEEYLQAYAQVSRKQKVNIPGSHDPLYLFALARMGDGVALKAHVASRCRGAEARSDACLGGRLFLELFEKGAVDPARHHGYDIILATPVETPIDLLGWQLLWWVHGADLAHDERGRILEEEISRCRERSLDWLAAELAEIAARAGLGDVEAHAGFARQLRERCGIRWCALDVIRPRPAWEAALAALAGLGGTGAATVDSPPAERLVWLLDPTSRPAQAQAKVQRYNARKGQWTSGRAVSLARLRKEVEDMPVLTEQDRRAVLDGIVVEHDPYDPWGKEHVVIHAGRLLRALVEHPLLFDRDGRVPLELLPGEPQLRVLRQDEETLRISLMPAWGGEGQAGTSIQTEGPTRYRLVEWTGPMVDVARIIGDGLTVPASAREQVLASLSAVSGLVAIQSDIGGGSDHRMVDADATLHLQLIPADGGLRVSMKVRPLGSQGPWHVPGQGGRTVLADVEGERLGAERDLALERGRAEAVVQGCSVLAADQGPGFDWLLEDAELALSLLVDLRQLGDMEGLSVEWPEGQKLRLAGHVNGDSLKLSTHTARDWLTVEGEVELPGGRTLELARLLQLLRQNRNSRFLPVGEDEYLSLTQEFRRRLDTLAALSDPHRDGDRLPLLAGLSVDDLAGEAGQFRPDQGWQSFRERFDAAMALEPRVPDTLQAELRDYQRDGFQWLMRLAHWGVGACLADDMGLGKTVQTLALLLARAEGGAALVVAPTSVMGNWQAEARRFAPTLQVSVWAGYDRGPLPEAAPFRVVVTSYGLLQQEQEALAAAHWHTFILDEAQAIKNPATKRARAACAIGADFRVAISGTPVENHLGELWSLFRFLNPGLLGAKDRFGARFANPIQKEGDPRQRQYLRRLIQPFILRRTKSEVLEELPPRTEILHSVELSEPERQFYDALRTRALLELDGVEDFAEPGRKSFRILAEITRLRRACCNPRLVEGGPRVPGAKLEALAGIVEELLDNGHKALVFSQFVDHLGIVREWLDERGIRYQYLDGSTPAKERDRRVQAFQAGEGELFLISLKAGGFGLTLTAADYVIHMDPWWNPAVEDQAADRAHRIGQQRPVTIYRLVTRDTIEERIVAMHRQKRDLADTLLAGGDTGGRVSADELLELLRGQ